MKQAILTFSLLIAFCVQAVAGAIYIPVSKHISSEKASGIIFSKKQLHHKIFSNQGSKHADLLKKKRVKCVLQDFIICRFSEELFEAQEQNSDFLDFIQNSSLSGLFFPNGKRGPPAIV